jgi:hypothetical protein
MVITRIAIVITTIAIVITRSSAQLQPVGAGLDG